HHQRHDEKGRSARPPSCNTHSRGSPKSSAGSGQLPAPTRRRVKNETPGAWREPRPCRPVSGSTYGELQETRGPDISDVGGVSQHPGEVSGPLDHCSRQRKRLETK